MRRILCRGRAGTANGSFDRVHSPSAFLLRLFRTATVRENHDVIESSDPTEPRLSCRSGDDYDPFAAEAEDEAKAAKARLAHFFAASWLRRLASDREQVAEVVRRPKEVRKPKEEVAFVPDPDTEGAVDTNCKRSRGILKWLGVNPWADGAENWSRCKLAKRS